MDYAMIALWRCVITLPVAFMSLNAFAAEDGNRCKAFKIPFRCHQEVAIDRRQYGYTDIDVSKNRYWKINTKFSNGKQVDGDNFLAVTSFYDADGKVIISIKQKKGLNGSGGGKATEGEVDSSGRFSQAQLNRVKRVRVWYGFYDRDPDKKRWDDARKIAEKIIENSE